MTISPTRFAAPLSCWSETGGRCRRRPPPLPRSEYVFAAVWAEGADVAVVYGASSSWSEELFVVDFAAVLYHGGFFADLATRLKELAKACRAQGCCMMAPGALIRHIEPHRLKVVEIPPRLDPAETLLFAAACIKSGRVKFCRRRLTSTITMPIPRSRQNHRSPQTRASNVRLRADSRSKQCKHGASAMVSIESTESSPI
jgi:hypothetical protein